MTFLCNCFRSLTLGLRWGVALFLLLLSALSGESANESPTHALDPVRLQLKWTHQFQFAGYYAAIEQGYYREAGLEVELIEAKPGTNPVDQVLTGQAEFGVGTSNLLLSRAQGKPVVVLGVIYQHSPLIILARPQSGISDLEDIVGKPIMIEPEEEDIFAYFMNEGVDPAKLKVIPHSFNLDDFISGKTAAMTAYSTDEPSRLRALGVAYQEFTPRSGGIDFYGDNLFTTEEQIRDHPERVRAFRAASLRGWNYALAHQAETVDLILRKYNRGRSRDQLLFEAQQTERLIHPELIELGYMNPGRWQHIQTTFDEQHMLPKPVNIKAFLYDPNPKPDLTLLYASLTALGLVAAGLLFWLLPLLYLNQKSRREIARRIVVEKELLAAKERTEEALAAQSRFLAMLSHEVRSPIGGIATLLELILQDQRDLPNAVRDDLHMVHQSAQSLHQLVDELLEWSRCEAGGVEIELTPMSLRPLALDLQRLFRPLAETKNVEVICLISPEVPETILSDELRLRQILSNLLANAIKFTNRGEVSLTVDRNAAGRLLFVVKDTGIGIPAAAMGRLFKPYQQADSSITRQFGGSGLGLSISLYLAKLLGGEIKVTSEVGRGSTFTLEIAAQAINDRVPEEGSPREPAPHLPRG